MNDDCILSLNALRLCCSRQALCCSSLAEKCTFCSAIGGMPFGCDSNLAVQNLRIYLEGKAFLEWGVCCVSPSLL